MGRAAEHSRAAKHDRSGGERDSEAALRWEDGKLGLHDPSQRWREEGELGQRDPIRLRPGESELGLRDPSQQ